MNTAVFSFLAPGIYISPLRGAYKGVLRYHLGLLVPKPEHSCRIRVRNHLRHWREGKRLIFDDSHEHEVWNDSDSYRVVLFVNIRRAAEFPLSLIIRLFIWIPCKRKMVAWQTSAVCGAAISAISNLKFEALRECVDPSLTLTCRASPREARLPGWSIRQQVGLTGKANTS